MRGQSLPTAVYSLRTSRSRLVLLIGRAAILMAATLACGACVRPRRSGGPDGGRAEVAVQILAFNDLHGHLAPTSPGGVQVGCCDPVRDAGGAQIGWTQKSVRAGGAEYLATHLAQLRHGHAHSVTVAAGDLIGGSPLVSALLHDEPTIEVSRVLGLELSAVGNHELDEGLPELQRIQNGSRPGGTGCHPSDGCQDGTAYGGAPFQYLSANIVAAGTGRTVFPSYAVRAIDGTKVAFVGLTLRSVPSLVAPSAAAGLEFRPEAEAANAVIGELGRREGISAFVVLLHQGGAQQTKRPVFPGPAEQPDAYADINDCENFTGSEVAAIVQALDSRARVVVTGHTHESYVCTLDGKLVTSASSFGRVVTDIELRVDPKTGRVTRASATNHVVTQDVEKDVSVSVLLAKYTELVAPIAHRLVGTLAGDIRSARDTPTGVNAAGEQPMGDVVADAMLGAVATDHPGATAAFTNTGGVRAGLLMGRVEGREPAGAITYEEAFAVQPFGDVLVVKRCSGRALYDALEQQFDNPSPGARRMLAVSSTVAYRWSALMRPRVAEGGLTIAGKPVLKERDYQVVLNDFLAEGGDGFTAFRDECTDPRGGPSDIDALVTYLKAHSPVAPPPPTRIIRID